MGAIGTMGAIATRLFPRPLFKERVKRNAKFGQIMSRERGRLASLQAKQSSPSSRACRTMDCFVASAQNCFAICRELLAMTGEAEGELASLHRSFGLPFISPIFYGARSVRRRRTR
jgi:hypothetical protein